MEGVDYSYSHPTPAQLVAGGKKFAVRYLTGTTNAAPGSKNLTPTEVAALQRAGIDIVSNVETSGGFLLDGYDATARLAERCWAQHKWCGGPDNRPLIFSLDFDATLNQYKVALQSLKGAGSAIGWGNVGMYGGLEQIDWAAQDGVKWLWQTLGWSYGQLSKHAQLYQYRNGVVFGSGLVDFDRSVNGATDFGQWKVKDMPLDDADKKWLLDNLRGARGVTLTTAVEKVEAVYNQNNSQHGGINNALAGLKTLVQQGGADPAAIAQAIGPGLADAVAAELQKLTLKAVPS